jgi:type IX secretion system PorP/SprF family membrane protein
VLKRSKNVHQIANKLFLLVFCLLLSQDVLHAQDPTFTQFYSNPLYLNPALAGSTGCPRINLNYRNEWPQLTGNYVTYSASFDTYSKDINGGVGLMATYDQQAEGTISTTMLGGIYSYNLKINRKTSLMFGARAAYYQKFLDWNKLTFGDMIDPRRGFIYQTNDVPRGGKRGFFDVSGGAVIFTKQFYAGVAAHHANQPDESMILGESKLPVRLTAHMGGTIPIGRRGRYSDGTSLKPALIYQYQNGFQELNIGAFVNYSSLNFGVWYRNKDAFVFIVGAKTDKFNIGYSYDLTVSKLGNGLTGGSHEISMQINLKCKKKAKNFRKISCPSF